MRQGILWIGSLIILLAITYSVPFELLYPVNGSTYTDLNILFHVNVYEIYNEMYYVFNGQQHSLIPNTTNTLYGVYGLNNLTVCHEYEVAYCEDYEFYIIDEPFILYIDKKDNDANFMLEMDDGWVFESGYVSYNDTYVFIDENNEFSLPLSNDEYTLTISAKNDAGESFLFTSSFSLSSLAEYNSGDYTTIDMSAITDFVKLVKFIFGMDIILGFNVAFWFICGLFAIIFLNQVSDIGSRLITAGLACSLVYFFISVFLGLNSFHSIYFGLISFIGVAVKWFIGD